MSQAPAYDRAMSVSSDRPAMLKYYLAAFAAILALKLSLLAISGPLTAGDTVGYDSFARAILADNTWLYDARLTTAALPATTLRIIGYPAMLALSHVLGGDAWRWPIVAAQIALSLSALFALTALRRPMGLSHGAMLFVLFAVATTSSLVLDAALLSDSLNAAVLTIAVTILTRAARLERPLSATAALGVGLLLAAAFLLREAMTYLSLALLPLLACAAGIFAPGRRWRGLALLVLTLLPLFAVDAGYSFWNRERTGTAFVTTGAQTSLLFPVVLAAAHEPAIFAGDTTLDAAARRVLIDFAFSDVIAINEHLFDDDHMTAPEIATAVYRKYFATWRNHPAAVFRVALGDMRLNQIFLLFRPVDALREYTLWATGEPSEIGRWKSVVADRRFLALYLAGIAEKAASTVLFAAFLLVPPWRLWREGIGNAPARLGAALWLLYLGWYAIYLVVHVETRYMAPLLPFAVLLGLRSLLWLRGPTRKSDSLKAAPRS
ncbi:MAG TPA: hypothetical protein VLX85_06645 [Stellaceae bacterium]|nr:hypothetical protein [Stellaceae bacterium]